ncbi:hypothetical protein FRC14_004741 [Serendipita sp. 396]|nr:hypothetical protein FRC14_004741 [Serendipita sp. 396]KAG8878732.1 hypothetical protein FRC20_006409 [Serendipita sp. 405]
MQPAGRELTTTPVFDYISSSWYSRSLCPHLTSQEELAHELTSNSGSESGEPVNFFDSFSTNYTGLEPISPIEGFESRLGLSIPELPISGSLTDSFSMDPTLPYQESNLRAEVTEQGRSLDNHPLPPHLPHLHPSISPLGFANTLSHHPSLYMGAFGPAADLMTDESARMQIVEHSGGEHPLHSSSSSSSSSSVALDVHTHTRAFEHPIVHPAALTISTSDDPSINRHEVAFHSPLAYPPSRHPSEYNTTSSTPTTITNLSNNFSASSMEGHSSTFALHSNGGQIGSYAPRAPVSTDLHPHQSADHNEDIEIDEDSISGSVAQMQTQTSTTMTSPNARRANTTTTTTTMAANWEGSPELAGPYQQLLGCEALASGEPIRCEYLDPFLEIRRLPESRSGKGSKNGADSYVCRFPSCRKKIVRRDHARDHIATHVGSRPHRCDDCGQSFLRPADMKRHYTRACRSSRTKGTKRMTSPTDATSPPSNEGGASSNTNDVDIDIDRALSPTPSSSMLEPTFTPIAGTSSGAGMGAGVGAVVGVDSSSSLLLLTEGRQKIVRESLNNDEYNEGEGDQDDSLEQPQQQQYQYQQPLFQHAIYHRHHPEDYQVQSFGSGEYQGQPSSSSTATQRKSRSGRSL